LVQKVPAPRAELLGVLLAAQLPGLLQVVLPRAAQQPAVRLRVPRVAQQERLLGQRALRQVQQALQLVLQPRLVPQLQLLQQLEQLQQLPLLLLLWQLLQLLQQPSKIQLPALLLLLPINRFQVLSA
jgi:hypothetical protein